MTTTAPVDGTRTSKRWERWETAEAVSVVRVDSARGSEPQGLSATSDVWRVAPKALSTEAASPLTEAAGETLDVEAIPSDDETEPARDLLTVKGLVIAAVEVAADMVAGDETRMLRSWVGFGRGRAGQEDTVSLCWRKERFLLGC